MTDVTIPDWVFTLADALMNRWSIGKMTCIWDESEWDGATREEVASAIWAELVFIPI